MQMIGHVACMAKMRNTCRIQTHKSRDCSVGLATDYRLGGRDSIPGKAMIFLLANKSRPALEPMKSPIQRFQRRSPQRKAGGT